MHLLKTRIASHGSNCLSAANYYPNNETKGVSLLPSCMGPALKFSYTWEEKCNHLRNRSGPKLVSSSWWTFFLVSCLTATTTNVSFDLEILRQLPILSHYFLTLICLSRILHMYTVIVLVRISSVHLKIWNWKYTYYHAVYDTMLNLARQIKLYSYHCQQLIKCCRFNPKKKKYRAWFKLNSPLIRMSESSNHTLFLVMDSNNVKKT